MAPPPYYAQLAADIERVGPKPTNAQALALIDAYGTLPMADADLDQALPTVLHLRWRAHGYVKPGDKFAAPTNAAFYASPYPDPQDFIGTLKWAASASDRYLASLVKAGEVDLPEPPGVVTVDPATASGDPAALAQELAQSWEALQAMRANGTEPMPPAAKPGKRLAAPTWHDLPSKPGAPTVDHVVTDDDGGERIEPLDGTPPTADQAASASAWPGDMVGPIKDGIEEAKRRAKEEAERLIRKARARRDQLTAIVVLVALIIAVAAWRRR